MFNITSENNELHIYCGEKLILSHSDAEPALYLGVGREKITMYRGNFDVRDRLERRVPLHFLALDGGRITFSVPGERDVYTVKTEEKDGIFYLESDGLSGYDRLWLRLRATAGEHVMGGGEQFSYLDLRGRLYPIWTREQGVGRNKLTEVTRLADCSDGGGGDYHTTFFPQPTFVSSEGWFAHLFNYEYAELDFRERDYHELMLWSSAFRLALGGGTYREMLSSLTALLGRQPELPEWAMRGLWLGVQGGTERATSLLQKCRDGGMDVSAVWIQDWEGKRVTSFGKRLQWDWRWNREMYPGLDEVIASDPDTRWMGYINPYLVKGGVLFAQAEEKGYFVKRADGTDYLFDFGEYDCGVVDLTSPAAYEWYKNVVKNNIIGLGFRGWMADFGEYLPADAVCADGQSGLTAHNRWPMLWAKLNREAVEECGLLGDCVFYMRAGAAESQRYSLLTWAGDQCVDWSEDDGLPSVITAALSLGMSGFGLHTCDTGGYTTLFHLKRDRELMLRWLEFTCFTPVMRTHEGNRPDSNIQVYSDEAMIRAAGRLTRLHTDLLPYMKHCTAENARTGVPVMRPLFLDAPGEERAYDRSLYSYMLGDDAVVCPVVEQGSEKRTLWLPSGEWVHLWSGESFGGGEHTVDAPMGKPPVFYRAGSEFAPLFKALAEKYA